jgi:5'-nucleotidase
MRILITNDDGIRSKGITTLTRTLSEAGHDVVVIAPETNMSGMSAALGPVEVGEHIPVTLTEVCGIEGYAVHAPPALAVFAAVQGAFGPEPDLVVSGVNAGLNTGRSVLHSGTVGAALTAATLGIDAMAVSVDVSDPWQFESACAIALQGLAWMEENPITGSVLNLNVPARPLTELHGLRWAQLDLFGAVQTAAHDPRRGLMFELRSEDIPPAPDSDLALIEAGFATASVLCPVVALDHEHLSPITRAGRVASHRQPFEVEASDEVITIDREERVLD